DRDRVEAREVHLPLQVARLRREVPAPSVERLLALRVDVDRALERAALRALALAHRGEAHERLDLPGRCARRLRVPLVERRRFALLPGVLVRLAHEEGDFLGGLVAAVALPEALPAPNRARVVPDRGEEEHRVEGRLLVLRVL